MPKSYHRHDDAVPDIRVDVALRDAIVVRSYCRLNHLGVVRCLRVGFDTETFNEACGRSAGVKRPRGSHWFDIEVGDRSRVGTFRSGRQGAAGRRGGRGLRVAGFLFDTDRGPARYRGAGRCSGAAEGSRKLSRRPTPPDRSEPALARDDQAGSDRSAGEGGRRRDTERQNLSQTEQRKPMKVARRNPSSGGPGSGICRRGPAATGR